MMHLSCGMDICFGKKSSLTVGIYQADIVREPEIVLIFLVPLDSLRTLSMRYCRHIITYISKNVVEFGAWKNLDFKY